MYYATLDNDGQRISENANITAFKTQAEAEAYVLSGIEDESDRYFVEEGDFGDCWIKVHQEPQDDERYFAPFARDDLHIDRPGQHPGGRAWWITPRQPVFVAVYR